MRLISPLLKKVVYPCLTHTGYLRRRAAEGIAIVSVAESPPHTEIESDAFVIRQIRRKEIVQQLADMSSHN